GDWTGSLYVLFVADRYDYQVEGDEGNNVLAVHLTGNARTQPDLKVTASTSPSSAGVGSSMNVSWTVTNQGGPVQGYWEDDVYLSADPYLDSSDVFVTYDYNFHNLAQGDSYVPTKSVTVPSLPAGAAYLLFVTDRYDYQTEGDETNNVRAVPIT